MSFGVVIVDDEPPSHQVLKSYIQAIPQLNLLGEFFNARDAEKFLSDCHVDILLLDIQMPEINGIEFLRSLKNKPVTIFSTAFRDYAFEGYELGVIDYLLKPVTFERFELAIRRAIDFVQLSSTEAIIDTEKKESFEILIKTGTRRILIDYRTIIYAQGLKDYTMLYTADKRYVVKGSVKAIEEYLPSTYFMRVHKSFLVARPLIRIVQRNKIEIGNMSVPIGRNYKEVVDQYLGSRGHSVL